MVRHYLIPLLGALLFLLGGGITSILDWPVPTGHQELDLPASTFQLNSKNTGLNQGQANPVQAHLSLDWPAEIWRGDQKKIWLTLTPVNPASSSDHPASPIGSISDHIVAESRLEIGSISPQDGDTLQQPWPDGFPLDFVWTVQSGQTGVYEGTVWFYVDLVTVDGKIAQRTPVSAQTIRIHVRDLYGVSPDLSRKAGYASGLSGLTLVISFAISRRQSRLAAYNRPSKKG